ncbi:DEAD-box ATP-dependent RNA helicase 42-like protein [Carex littledalei]|uniref:RNA helicase n=1 Tax=Carex littledalei TaxID=544730 RepID=A0A833QPT5_9POAL|nr:DEAD-box ATP-dependent RNA helicase 42-like protein [Carex littledalei]
MATEDGRDRSRRDREKDRDRERERDKEYREKEKKEKEKHRSDKDRHKEKSRDKDRERDRDKAKGREKERVRDDYVKDRDRDRRERERDESDKEEKKAGDMVERERDDYHKEKERKTRHKEERDRDNYDKEKDRKGRDREERDKDDYDREKERKARERDDYDLKERKARDREERERDDYDKEERKAGDREEKESESEREEYEKEKDKEKEKGRLKEKGKKVREKEERDEHYERESERYGEKEKERKHREREDREREKEKERARRKEEKERQRDDREREKRKREADRDEERRRRDADRGQDREAEREHKRRKKDSEEGSSKSTSREDELQEEQKKLEDEMEKRRKRVQEWQELRRIEKQEREPAVVGKKWTLEGESDEEEDREKTEMEIDTVNGENVPNGELESKKEEEEEEIDPLDAFMTSVVLPEVEKLQKEPPEETKRDGSGSGSEPNKKGTLKGVNLANGISKKGKNMGRIIPGEESDTDFEVEDDEAGLEDEDDDEFMKRVKKTKVDKLALVDHSKINYPPFRKSFYKEVKEITKMTPDEVTAYRKELELKVHGKDVPKPIKTWVQSGLTSKILDTIKKLNFEKPMSIQTQALPIIMSGRDCIGVAKTGSGKTIAFVLPMLRHIKDQLPVMPGEGPIALVMAPTRELVQQIHSDIKKFSKAIGVNCVAVYGGSGVAQQISDLKRGTEIVVCTPGRMIDILCTSSGKITNLRRVTYLVMDEADRMFDMGFEPQISRIVQNTQPERQTVLFSATFPRQVEILARRVLTKPVEIQVGGRSVVNKDITQLVEVRPESDRFLRLLELLGEWYEKGKMLVFVHSQDKCDSLFRELLKHGYPCLSLHGAKDQTDRESTISDFKSNVCNLLIATSVAARGLDVKELELVVNFDVPNHYEDYVHRVGRTGRAGRKGLAVTFISEEEERYAPDLVKALELSEQAVPADLKMLAVKFMAKVKQGTETVHGTGYGGSGFKFNEEEDDARKAVKKAQLKEYGYEEDKSDSDSEDEAVRKTGGVATLPAPVALPQPATQPSSSTPVTLPGMSVPLTLPGGVSLPLTLTGAGGVPVPVTLPGGVSLPPTFPAAVAGSPAASEAAARAVALAAAINLQHNLAKIQADALPEHYEAELEINDFPQNARWRITHKDTLGPISDWTGAAITTRGQYYPPGKIVGPGERKLYLFIEGPTESSVKKAKAELKKVLEDCTSMALNLPGSAQVGKYSVV